MDGVILTAFSVDGNYMLVQSIATTVNSYDTLK